MKKLSLLILICVLVASLLCVPTFAVAESKVATDVHFIAPTGIALVGDYLLISDNVADNQSAILCFDVSDDAHAHKFTYLLDKQAVSITSSNGRLFVIFADSFVEYEFTKTSNTLTKVEEFAFANVIDVCVGKLGTEGNLADTIYFLQKGTNGDSLKYVKADKSAGAINGISVANAYNCLAMDDGVNNYVYIAGKNADGTNSITRWGSVWGWDIQADALNANGVIYVGNFALLGIATNNRDYPFVYGAKSMYNLNLNQSTNSQFGAEQGFEDFSEETHNIIKVATNQNLLVILNSYNQVQIYQLDDDKLGAEKGAIGSDQVQTDVPTTYTGFTLAKSSGYPTNIIYKTTGDASIDNILTKDQVDEFVILNYQGATNSSYYYVFVNGKFGWIKKSDNATTPQTDDKIEIVDTNVSDKVTYNAKFKFNSLGNVYIYDLPCSDKNVRKLVQEIAQTGADMKEVKILQQFKEGDILWYYVEYEEGKFGFVKSSDVGQFTATLVGPVDAVLDKQINASLFNAVTLHMTKELSQDTIVTYDGVTPVKLYSGDWVKVIQVDEDYGAAFIQVVNRDGTTTFGWVESTRLVDLYAITTNAIVGFVALGIALVLAIVFITVFIKRKKKVRK